MDFFNGAVNYEDLKQTPVPELHSLVAEANIIRTRKIEAIKNGV
jgi:hypothetical protein